MSDNWWDEYPDDVAGAAVAKAPANTEEGGWWDDYPNDAPSTRVGIASKLIQAHATTNAQNRKFNRNEPDWKLTDEDTKEFGEIEPRVTGLGLDAKSALEHYSKSKHYRRMARAFMGTGGDAVERESHADDILTNILPKIPESDRNHFLAQLHEHSQISGPELRGNTSGIGKTFQKIDRGYQDIYSIPGRLKGMALDSDKEAADRGFLQQAEGMRRGTDRAQGNSLLGEASLQAAGMVPALLTARGVGAGVGAATEAAAGAIMPGLPLTAQAVGGVGQAAGEFGAWYAQSVPQIYDTLRENNVDDTKAKWIAAVTAVPYAAIEQIQMGHLSPQLVKGAKDAAQQAMWKHVLNRAGHESLTVGKEGVEEYGQNLLEVGAQAMGSYLSNNPEAKDFDWRAALSEANEQTRQSLLPLAMMRAPGAAVDFAAGRPGKTTQPEQVQVKQQDKAKPVDEPAFPPLPESVPNPGEAGDVQSPPIVQQPPGEAERESKLAETKQANEAEAGQLGKEERDLYERFYGDPATAVQWADEHPEEAKKLAESKTYRPQDFQAIDPDLPFLHGRPGDAPLRRQWQAWVRQQLEAGTQNLATWQKLPEGVEPPNHPSIQVEKTPLGTFVRAKTKEQAQSRDTVSQPQEAPGKPLEASATPVVSEQAQEPTKAAEVESGAQATDKGQATEQETAKAESDTVSQVHPDIQAGLDDFHKKFGVRHEVVEPANDNELEVADFAKARGIPLVFIKGGDTPFAHGRAVFIPSGAGVDALWDAAGHEIAHSAEIDRDDSFDPDVVEASAQRYLAKQKNKKYRAAVANNPALRKREGIANLVGEFMSDPEFRDRLQTDKPDLWTRIKDAVLRVFKWFTPKSEAAQQVLDKLRNSVAKPEISDAVSQVPVREQAGQNESVKAPKEAAQAESIPERESKTDGGATGALTLGKELEHPRAKVGLDIVKRMAREMAEFRYNPVFTVDSKKNLVWRDGTKFSLPASSFNLDAKALQDGQNVAIDTGALGIKSATESDVVREALKNAGFHVTKSAQPGRFTIKWGQDSNRKMFVIGEGQDWHVEGPRHEEAHRAEQTLERIRWKQPGQVEDVPGSKPKGPIIGESTSRTPHLSGAPQLGPEWKSSLTLTPEMKALLAEQNALRDELTAKVTDAEEPDKHYWNRLNVSERDALTDLDRYGSPSDSPAGRKQFREVLDRVRSKFAEPPKAPLANGLQQSADGGPKKKRVGQKKPSAAAAGTGDAANNGDTVSQVAPDSETPKKRPGKKKTAATGGAPSGNAYAQQAGRGAERKESASKEATPVGTLVQPTVKPMPMPELVQLAKDIMGKLPTVTKRLTKSLGVFNGAEGFDTYSQILIRPDVASDERLLAEVLAHEIGHLTDFTPDATLSRGNILGRIATLRKYLKGHLDGIEGSKKEITDEIKAVSAWWRPWDRDTADAKFRAYRDSSKELYADALSVFLNSPGDLESRAPKFWKGLTDFLDRKPDFLNTYLELQGVLNGSTEGVAERRRDTIQAMFTHGDEKIRASLEAAKAAEQSVGETVRQFLEQYVLDTSAPIKRRVRLAEKRGAKFDEAENAEYVMDELFRMDNPNHVMLDQINEQVWQPLKAAGLTRHDIGEYMFLRRIMNERNEIANPLGFTPSSSAAQIEDLQRKLGKEKYAELEKRMDAFHNITFASVERAVETGVYNRELFKEKIEPNKGNYATFAVVKYLEAHVPASVYKQVGTFEEVANPFDASIMKLITLNRLIELNHAKAVVADMLKHHFPEDIQSVEIPHGQKEPSKRPPHGTEYLTVMEDGRNFAYAVPKEIAVSFQKHDVGGLARMANLMHSKVYGVFHPLYVAWNIKFQVSNMFRDFRRTAKNLGAIGDAEAKAEYDALVKAGRDVHEAWQQAKGKKISLGSVLRAYLKAMPASYRRARGMSDETINAMMESKALDTPFNDIDLESSEVGQFERLLQRHGLAEIRKDEATAKKAVGVLIKAVEANGVFQETLSKVAGWNLLNDRRLGDKKSAFNVRKFVGTPDYKQRGLATPITNSVFMYSKVRWNGMQADLGLATDPKTAAGFWWRQLAYNTAPTLAMKAAKYGLLGPALAALFAKIPQYFLDNYDVVPIGAVDDDDDKKDKESVLFTSVPKDDTGRFIDSITSRLFDAFMEASGYKTTRGSVGKAVSGSADELLSQLVPEWNPILDIGSKWSQFAAGKNPYDMSGKPIVPKTEWQAGGRYAVEPMLHWTINKFGAASDLLSPVTDKVLTSPYADQKAGAVKTAINTIPGLGRLLRVSNRGETELEWAEIENEDREKARFRLGLPEEAKKLTRERYLLDRRGVERLDDKEKLRRAVLNNWYSGVYLKMTKLMKIAEDQGDKELYQEALKTLKEQTGQFMEMR